MAEDIKLVNGEILAASREKLKVLLSKRMSSKERLQWETIELLVMYLQWGHPKTAVMWNVFRPMAWGMVIVAGSLLGAVATGHLGIQFIVK